MGVMPFTHMRNAHGATQRGFYCFEKAIFNFQFRRCFEFLKLILFFSKNMHAHTFCVTCHHVERERKKKKETFFLCVCLSPIAPARTDSWPTNDSLKRCLCVRGGYPRIGTEQQNDTNHRRLSHSHHTCHAPAPTAKHASGCNRTPHIKPEPETQVSIEQQA